MFAFRIIIMVRLVRLIKIFVGIHLWHHVVPVHVMKVYAKTRKIIFTLQMMNIITLWYLKNSKNWFEWVMYNTEHSGTEPVEKFTSLLWSASSDLKMESLMTMTSSTRLFSVPMETPNLSLENQQAVKIWLNMKIFWMASLMKINGCRSLLLIPMRVILAWDGVINQMIKFSWVGRMISHLI